MPFLEAWQKIPIQDNNFPLKCIHTVYTTYYPFK